MAHLPLYVCAVMAMASAVFAQTPPPINRTIHCETLDNTFGLSTPVTGHPYWALVLNTNSEYWIIVTFLTQFGGTGWVQGTVISLFDSDGHLIAQNEFARPDVPYSSLLFGSIWTPGSAGSPTMLTPGANYYLGVAGRGSVFRDGFECDISSDSGRVTAFAQPTPGAATLLVAALPVALRRRR